MIDPKLLREQPDVIREALKRRGIREDLERLLDVDKQRRALITRIEAKQAAIQNLAGPDAHTHVLGRYTGLLSATRDGRLGGAAIYGTKLTPA